MERRLAITKRISLDGFEGWDNECYVTALAWTFKEKQALRRENMDSYDEVGASERLFEIVKEHIVSGKLKLLNADQEVELVDYSPELLELLPDATITRIFMEITGAQYEDPKGLNQTQTPSVEPQKPGNSSETPSSED